ncbi:11191_t:CDS:1 [Scutellospora calospora]|uniref:11191_t:CDS:1 n=1 Tax=Scutellospora calospora TaxID=85575 RepID=A0ACA9JTS6_9GLOM|nr:11191_t:CDS:1 [Scutellospora calospora]
MYHKLSVNFSIFLVFLLHFTYSAPHDTIEAERQNIDYFCRDGNSQNCCPHLANRVANENFSRCASIILINNSGFKMTLVNENLEDGRWVTSHDYYDGDGVYIDCMPHTLLNYESEAISSVSSHFLGGVQGYVGFIIDDDFSSKFFISWDVPLFSSPKYHFSFLNESYMYKYNIKVEQSFGDTVYKVTIGNGFSWLSLFIFPLPFFVIIPCCCCYPSTSNENLITQQSPESLGQRGQHSYGSFGQQERQFSDSSKHQGQRPYNNSYINNNRNEQQGQNSYNNPNGDDQPPPYDHIFP